MDEKCQIPPRQPGPCPKCGKESICGGQRRSDGFACHADAGKGTDHLGEGRCKHHGGASIVKHGRYSKVRREPIRKLIAEFEEDPDPLDLLPDLAAMRALFTDFVERYDEWREAILAWHASFGTENGNAKPRQILDLADATRILDRVGKMVERIEKVRSANAISQPEFYRMMGEMGRVVAEYVEDEELRGKIREGWLAIRVRPNP